MEQKRFTKKGVTYIIIINNKNKNGKKNPPPPYLHLAFKQFVIVVDSIKTINNIESWQESRRNWIERELTEAGIISKGREEGVGGEMNVKRKKGNQVEWLILWDLKCL